MVSPMGAEVVMRKIAFVIVLALAPFLPVLMTTADARHVKPRPHHAHLIKRARSVDVQVAVPARLMAPKPPADHHKRKRRRR